MNTSNTSQIQQKGNEPVSSPHNSTVSWGPSYPPGPTREDDLAELELLTRLLKDPQMQSSQCILGRVHDAIHLKLDELYPELIDEEYIHPTHEISNEIFDALIKDEPLDDKTAEKASGIEYYHWAQALYYLGHMPCTVARSIWDNSLNKEFIMKSEDGKLMKVYSTESPDYNKYVEHTYKPTQEDIEATDWYII